MSNRRIYGGSKETVSDIFHENLPISKQSEGLLNHEAIGRQFGSAGVYDGSAISITPERIPGSRGTTDKNNARRKGKVVG